jgi:hypothetical protein
MKTTVTSNIVQNVIESGTEENVITSENTQNVIYSRDVVALTLNGGSCLAKAFSHTDTSAASLKIAAIPANRRVSRVVLEVTEAFGAGFYLTVGDAVGQARLMTVNDSYPQEINSFSVDIDYLYSERTDLYIYFGASSATGNANIIIYYS